MATGRRDAFERCIGVSGTIKQVAMIARFVLRFAVGLTCLSLTAFPDCRVGYQGRLVAVTDGGRLTMLDGRKHSTKSDAPESGQAFGTQVKKALSELVGKEVKVYRTGEDRYSRPLGHVYLGDRWRNHDAVEGDSLGTSRSTRGLMPSLQSCQASDFSFFRATPSASCGMS